MFQHLNYCSDQARIDFNPLCTVFMVVAFSIDRYLDEIMLNWKTFAYAQVLIQS